MSVTDQIKEDAKAMLCFAMIMRWQLDTIIQIFLDGPLSGEADIKTEVLNGWVKTPDRASELCLLALSETPADLAAEAYGIFMHRVNRIMLNMITGGGDTVEGETDTERDVQPHEGSV